MTVTRRPRSERKGELKLNTLLTLSRLLAREPSVSCARQLHNWQKWFVLLLLHLFSKSDIDDRVSPILVTAKVMSVLYMPVT